MAQEITGTPTYQLKQLSQFDSDDEVWEHANTRTIYVGQLKDDDEGFVLLGTVDEYRKIMQDLIDAV